MREGYAKRKWPDTQGNLSLATCYIKYTLADYKDILDEHSDLKDDLEELLDIISDAGIEVNAINRKLQNLRLGGITLTVKTLLSNPAIKSDPRTLKRIENAFQDIIEANEEIDWCVKAVSQL